jgi:hypothetical protein
MKPSDPSKGQWRRKNMHPNGIKLKDKSSAVGDGEGRGKNSPEETPTEACLEKTQSMAYLPREISSDT